MNNIYKVIWSKAKNCYVVASEIARSHTKSATGSEKIGGVTRRSLLASLMALSLLCGGLGVASAANGTVHVAESAASSDPAVYTTEKVNTLLEGKADKTALENKANATDVAKNTENIATNTANINTLRSELGNKADESTVTAALGGKANTSLNNLDEAGKSVIKTMMADELAKKADKSYVDNAVAGAVTTAGTNVNEKLKDYAKTTYVDTEVGKKANKATTLAGYEITDAYTKEEVYNKGEVARKLDKKADLTALNQATDKINDQQTAIDDLKKKTAEISHVDGDGTNISGVKITDGNIVGNGHSAITGLTNVETNQINGKSLAGTTVATATEVEAAVKAETDARTEADNKLEEKITKNREDIATLNGKVATAEGNITDLKAKDTDLEKKIQTNADNIQTNSKAIADTNKRTGGIARNLEDTQTTIEGSVKVDNKGNVKDVTELSAKKITTTEDADLKGDVTLGTTNGTNTVTVNGTANFHEAVNMDKGLNVTNGETNLGNTTVDGNLKVTGTITTDKMVFGDKATNNYTEIDQGHITSKNDALASDATQKSSSMELDHSKLEVAVTDKDSNGHLTMTADKTSIKNSDLDGKNYSEIVADKDSVRTTVKDEKDNTTSTKSSATEIRNYAGDAAGNKTNNVQTATQNKSWAKDKDGNESSIVQTGKDITNTAQNGTITNDANHIENTANTMNTTVSGQATESYGKLDTTVNGAENHTVNGQQTNTVGDGQINNITGGQTNNILTGDQKTTVSDGSIINKAEHGDISNTAKNVTNEGTESVTNKVGTNEVKVSKDGVDIKVDADKTIKESVGADTSRTMTDGNIIDKAGDMTVTTDKTTGTTFRNGTLNDTTVINGGTIGTNKVNANETNTKKLTAGAAADANGGRLTVDANDGVKGSYKFGDYTSKSYILANTLKSGVDNGKEPIDADFVGSRTDHYMVGDKAKLDETVKDADGSNVTNKTSTSTKSTIKKGDITTAVKQEGDKIESSIIKDDNSQSNVTTSTVEATANAVTGKDANGNAQTSTVINNKDGLLITNTDNQTSFTTEDGTSTDTAQNWTNIKGNEISTGKVEANYVKMDYADVMRDLGVHGNAKIDGKTTTGSLEVTGTSTLKGDVTMESNATVNGNFNVKGDTNLKNTKVDGTLNVTQKATFDDSVSIAKDLSVTGDVTAKSYNVDGKTYIDANGIHANNQKITDVADGSISEGSKDAVNGGQLYDVKRDMEHKVDKVGANAAAMANLRPMEFDPDSKWNIAAAIGNYGSETAAALGAFYRPNDDVMVNLSTAFGTGENMVGGGVSVRLGKGGNKLSREESNALKDQVNDLTARMDALLSVLNPNMSKDFPDVPENHWAYEAVSRLAGNDIVQGYPDGEFHGERTMTRYEMAEIIYNALSRGAEAEKELVEEFKPELQAMAASEKATAEKAEG